MNLVQLQKFVKRRNKSSHHDDIQFEADARECRIRVGEFGNPISFMLDSLPGSLWRFAVDGSKDEQVLIEYQQKLYLLDENVRMFQAMSRAIFGDEKRKIA